MASPQESRGNHAAYDNSDQTSAQQNGHGDRPRLFVSDVQKVIDMAQMSGKPILDISKLELSTIPQPVLDWSNLQHLSLENNKLPRLPDDFFKDLPCLKWLDLRFNILIFLPAHGLGEHQCLKNLLLQGNRIRTLPLELGLVATLRGLSLSDNPLEFPPADIIRLGTVDVLQFLREQLEQGVVHVGLTDRMTELSIRDNDSSASTTDEEVQGPHGAVYSYRSVTGESNLGLEPRPAALHQPTSFQQIRQQHRQKVHKAGASGKKSNLSNLRRKSDIPGGGTRVTKYSVVTPYGRPRTVDQIEDVAKQERTQARIKEINEKTDSILQRRRNFDALSDFRQESKDLQRKKYREVVNRGTDYVDTASVAPYGYEEDAATLPTRTELHKNQIRKAHERIARPMSPASLERMERERAARDRELENKVKLHTTSMIERRKRQKGSAADEMEAARKELQMGLQLERELQQRRKELEYRFQAFTGDIPLSKKK